MIRQSDEYPVPGRLFIRPQLGRP